MATRKHKAAVRTLLEQRDLDGVAAWSGSIRSPFRPLLSHAYDPDELIRWRTVEAVARVAAQVVESSPEKVRELIRRLFWLMNDESGGLCRIAPEIIGETLVRVPFLIEEYAPMLPAFLVEEPFERGTHWALWRLSCLRAGLFADAADKLKRSLADPDPGIRAFSALTLALIEGDSAGDGMAELENDKYELSLYSMETGRLLTTTVGALVSNPPVWCTELKERAARRPRDHSFG
jgi:methylated-DNA-[protein]-cysteine S-methyltransferase